MSPHGPWGVRAQLLSQLHLNSDGNLFLLHHAVARLLIDQQGRIRGAEPAIHRSLSGFIDFEGGPPGDQLQSNKKTPFVWADEHS